MTARLIELGLPVHALMLLMQLDEFLSPKNDAFYSSGGMVIVLTGWWLAHSEDEANKVLASGHFATLIVSLSLGKWGPT